MSVERYIVAMTDTTNILAAAFALFGLLLAPAITEAASPDKYKVTAAEKAACTEDAIRLCMDAYPNEDKLVGCMRTNHASLSATCQVAFDAGLKRRHMR